MAAAGFETQGLVTNPGCLPVWGIGDEFMFYGDVESRRYRHRDDTEVTDRAIEAARFAAGRPWFFYVHAMGPHAPYEPPGEYATMFQSPTVDGDPLAMERLTALNLYDGEIACTDMHFGRLINELKTLGLYDNTIIIFLSDHGEEFREHGGDYHGKTLYEEQLRVPLLIKLPHSARAGERRNDLIEMVDVAPTILDLVGMPDGSAYAMDGDRVVYIRDGRTRPVSGVSGVYMITQAGPDTAYAYSTQAVWTLKDGQARPVR